MLAADTAPSSLAGLQVVDRRGERLGRVRQVYRDGAELGWVGVRGNLFGTEEVLVPLDGAAIEDDVIGVPVTRDRFQTAPRRRPDAPLDADERDRLRAFWTGSARDPALDEPAATEASAAEAPTAVASSAEESGIMTAFQERLHIGTERVPRTRVRLRKVVVTEQRTVDVPVRHEEYRLIREPITDADPVVDGVIGPDEQEVVLYEERVVVTTEVVPVERIRLVKEEVVETREVSGSVRLERIELADEGDASELAQVGLAPAETAIAAEREVPNPGEARPQLTARAMATNRPTSSRSPRRPGSTPARSRTSAAADAPPSTGASD
ncbi:MAG: PRC and DUF2382 domain-containing protein [Acidobacteria bacterium]|nr:PRC and DUF2382 domain-containing protein [Acidobacteriota bacterium]